jgi:glycosyltransferase involved in cell wall biosynthesis
MVIAESFAAGIPVICANVGSAPSIVEDGLTGVHFRAGDPADLVRAVSWCVSHPDALSDLSARARCLYESRYTAARNYALLEAVYRRAAAGHGHPGSGVLDAPRQNSETERA